MTTTMTLSQSLNLSPFDIFDRDTDEVVTLINFYIRKGEASEKDASRNGRTSSNNGRVRVNDSTATGGWW